MTRENEVVDERNADFLWHSNEALRKALEKKEKELKRVIASMQS
jgi:hypothetical protein